MRQLAEGINRQLKLLNRERHRFWQGDRELKEAITNISHDGPVGLHHHGQISVTVFQHIADNISKDPHKGRTIEKSAYYAVFSGIKMVERLFL